MKILVINGPNLNLLGVREPEIYGYTTLEQIMQKLCAQAKSADVELEHFQSNAESELIEKLHAIFQLDKSHKGSLLTRQRYAYRVALRDAIAAVALPFIEVHLSNVHQREAFRQHSYFSDLAEGVIAGLGAQGYEFALHALINIINSNTHNAR